MVWARGVDHGRCTQRFTGTKQWHGLHAFFGVLVLSVSQAALRCTLQYELQSSCRMHASHGHTNMHTCINIHTRARTHKHTHQPTHLHEVRLL